MGVDFITTCTPTFTRGWDIGLADAQTATLFTDLPAETTRTYRVSKAGDHGLADGDTVFLRPGGDGLTVIKGRCEVSRIPNPSPALTERLAAAGRGIATATVTRTFPRSGDFEVRVL